jgi:chemotaxis protein MotA
MSKSATILGLLLGFIIISLSMYDFDSGKIISAFFNLQGLAVVLGGTLAAVMINYPLNQLSCAFNGVIKVFAAETPSIDKTIEELEHLSTMSHKQGVLSLEPHIEELKDPFMRFAVTQLMIYQDDNGLMASLNTNLNNMQLRHLQCQELFHNMASYSPAFGMMGTVMGLIIMMTSQASGGMSSNGSEDMLAGLLQGMGLALVTTFYGVLFSNLLFIPVAGKLKVLSEAETLKNEVIIRAMVGIRHLHSPLLVKESLLSFVNEKTKERLETYR